MGGFFPRNIFQCRYVRTSALINTTPGGGVVLLAK